MKKIRVGINGFGRIGRTLFKVLDKCNDVEVRMVNDVHSLNSIIHLLKYDSVHGRFSSDIKISGNETGFWVNDAFTTYTCNSDIQAMNWDDLDIVFECTGKYKSKSELTHHLTNGATKVILSVPPSDNDLKMVVKGVNESILTHQDKIFSNASCTTNSAAHLVHIMKNHFDIKGCFITTVHSYTTDQNLHDAPHRDLRRSRAAVQSIIPTTTGAAKALTTIFPDLADVIGGCGIRVPVPDGSLTDLTFTIDNPPSAEKINELIKEASKNELEGLVSYCTAPIVSSDVIGSPYSCVFDAELTSVVGNMVKLVGWYDNEMGYSHRLKDMMYYAYSLK